MHATLEAESLAMVGRPAPVFSPCVDQKLEFPVLEATDERIDVTGDGTRFLVTCRPAAAPPVITVVVNWQSKLK